MGVQSPVLRILAKKEDNGDARASSSDLEDATIQWKSVEICYTDRFLRDLDHEEATGGAAVEAEATIA